MRRTTNMFPGSWAIPVLGMLLVAGVGGCTKFPQQALDEANKARLGADFASRCAPEEFAAAQRMMDRARELGDKEEYKEAEEAYKSAKLLFEKAIAAAESRREECLRRLTPPAADAGLKQPEFTPAPGEGDYDLKMIHFGFDQATIEPEDRATLEAHARWLKGHADVRIQISGHCDEAGSTEYNLALGERRADAVKKYLISLGVTEDRLSTISYGEELPLQGAAQAQNRRAEFTRR
jgi:peptidoglycan-associated lipoprotein